MVNVENVTHLINIIRTMENGAIHVTRQLTALRRRAGLNKTELAKLLGYKGVSSYQRYEDPDEYPADHYNIKFVRRLAKALVGRGKPKIKPDEIYRLAGLESLQIEPLDDVVDVRTGAVNNFARGLRLLGKVAAGSWLELYNFTEIEPKYVPISPHPDYPREAQYALEVEGESVNKLAKDGDYIVCVDVLESGIAPRIGDLVVVERKSDDDERIEVTVKRLLRAADGTLSLHPESNDPRYQEPIPIDGSAESSTVQIRAIVLSAKTFVAQLSR